MGRRTLSEDEAVAGAILAVALRERVVGNEDGGPGKCDLRVVAGDGSLIGYVEVTQLIGGSFAMTSNNLTGNHVIDHHGRLGFNWWVEVDNLTKLRLGRLRSGGLVDLLVRVEAAGLERLPTIPTLRLISSEIDIASARQLDVLTEILTDCDELGVVGVKRGSSSEETRRVVVTAHGSLRAGWPGSGAAGLPAWLNTALDEEKLAKKVRKLGTTGVGRQHLFLWIPDLLVRPVARTLRHGKVGDR
jgi:hypothetical protein